jgi:uncharacterized protein (TIGR02001 family)
VGVYFAKEQQMNGLIRWLAAIVVLVAVGGAAQAASDDIEFSGNVTLATDYRFRGISQLDNSPAIQGGFDLETDMGIYVGAWASNIGFGGGGSQIEIDGYIGYAAEIDDVLSYDVGFMYYGYPQDNSDPNLDYYEIYASLSFFDATVGINVSPDYFAETDTFVYLYGDYGHSFFSDRLNVSAHVGWNQFEDDSFNAFFGSTSDDDGYLDWSLTLSTEAYGVEWALAYVDTNVSESDCFGGTDLCEETAVLSMSKSL